MMIDLGALIAKVERGCWGLGIICREASMGEGVSKAVMGFLESLFATLVIFNWMTPSTWFDLYSYPLI